MFRLRSKSGEESVFRTPEEIRSALLSGFVTPDAQIWDAALKGWVPLLEHALYRQIADAPAARKSGSTKSIPAAKPVPKLVIKRPGDGATTAMPAMKPPVAPPPAPKPAPKPAEELPELEMIDLDLSSEPVAPATPAKAAPPPAPPKRETPAAPPKRPTPPPAPAVEAPAPRVSVPRPAPEPEVAAPMAMRHTAETIAAGGSKKGLIIAAVVVLALGGGAFAFLRGRGATATPTDSLPAAAATPVAADSSAATVTDTAKHDATAAPAVDTTHPAPAPAPTPVAATTTPAATPAAADTASASGSFATPFAPTVDRGPASWNSAPFPGVPLSLPALETVRLNYAAAQARAQATLDAGLEVAEFKDLFDPARVTRADRRDGTMDAIDGARSALRDFRRRQAVIDFAYSDTLRRALPPGSDAPDLRTFGPLLRETPAQAALTDSIVNAVAEMYGLIIGEAGGYTFRAGHFYWKDKDNADQYQVLEERLTAQLGRLRGRNPADIPPAMREILQAIGLPR